MLKKLLDERHYLEFEQFSSDDCNNLYAIFINYVKNHILSWTEAALRVADNIAVLLEPDTSQRNNAAEFVNGLYKARSDALHGRQIEAERATRFNARHSAAAVLSAVISRRDFLRRSGYEPESPQDLLQDLRKSRFDSGQPRGVPQFNVRELWRKKSDSL